MKQEEQDELSGIFRRTQKGFGFVKLVQTNEEIYIAMENAKNALNGDNVKVKIIKDATDGVHKEGKIIEITEREKDTLVGVFQNNKNFGFVVPDDKKYGTDIFISKGNFGKARNNQKVLVKITKFPEKGKNAEGKIIEVIGNINEAGVDMLSLIKEYGLPYRFPEEVVREAKSISQQIPNSNRMDLTKEEIFTIDGEDAKDLDDAVCVKKKENGLYELSVHIADVSHYVKENSNLDGEAIIRGTSVYMMDRVIPMLPRELSNGICSLNAKQDRFALSVIMEIDENGQVVASDIKKTIINVTERMSYTGVAIILKYINGEELNKKELDIIDQYNKYIKHFKEMNELANILKKKRVKNGSLDLDVPESKIILDNNGIAVDVKKYESSFANEIIEQFMLIANEVVAERFYWLEAPFIYRVHEEPDRKSTRLNSSH